MEFFFAAFLLMRKRLILSARVTRQGPDALPATVDEEENPIPISATTAFVLNKPDGDKPVDSAWIYDGEWTELVDE